MVNEYTSQPNQKYTYGEQVDCRDERGHWLNGEVLESTSDRVKVHFTGFHKKFDTWLPDTPEFIQKQWRKGHPFSLNNRIDVLDTYKKWKEATIIDLNSTQICVHYKGFTSRWDEWINFNSERIHEIGSKSAAYGVGKVDPHYSIRYGNREVETEIRVPDLDKDREARFSHELAGIDLKIIEVEGDGNCLFRSVSHQLYGETAFHDIIREKVMEYISIERVYFEEFVAEQEFEEYLTYQSRNGAWGGDIEIEAMCEIYNRPFEIYAYSNTPMKTFHENQGVGHPLKLAYHGQSHYNSIVNKDKHIPLLSNTPGDLESFEIEKARNGELDSEVFAARELFSNFDNIDIEEALQASISQFEEESINRTMQESQQNQDEEALLQQAIQESMRDDDLEAALARSMNEISAPSCIESVLALGFPEEAAIQAWSIVGDDPDMIVDYILSNF